MTVISLSQIVKNLLIKRGYSVHWFLQFLVYARDGLREIAFDENINTLRYKLIPLDSNSIGELPNDFHDYARVSVRIDQYLRPLVEENALDTIPNYDSEFVEQPYTEGVASDDNTAAVWYNGYLSPLWKGVNWNSYGENTGRQFGGVGVRSDTFKIDKTRRIIKVNEYLSVTEVVMEYIGDGTDADSSTHINPYCQASIEAFIMWQLKEHSRTYSNGEAEMERSRYVQERQILRGRLSDLTMDKLKRIVQGNSISVKY